MMEQGVVTGRRTAPSLRRRLRVTGRTPYVYHDPVVGTACCSNVLLCRQNIWPVRDGVWAASDSSNTMRWTELSPREQRRHRIVPTYRRLHLSGILEHIERWARQLGPFLESVTSIVATGLVT